MIYELPQLPYNENALEPYISRKTLHIHHDVLQRRYVKRLNELARGPWSGVPLEHILVEAPDGELYDNAAQVFNHTFYWHSMKRNGGSKPSVRTGFGQAMLRWGNRFQTMFVDYAKGLFGSGYVWFVADQNGDVLLWPAANADNPMRYGYRPLLTMDVWEHAYFLDHGADREKYARVFLENLVNWEFAESNYARAFGA